MIAAILLGCGVETATTAATAAKLQADQAKEAQKAMDKAKADVDAAMMQSEKWLKRAEDAN
jgi:hypothetical protein